MESKDPAFIETSPRRLGKSQKGMAMTMNQEKSFRLPPNEAETSSVNEDTAAAEQAPFKVFATQEEYQTYFDRILGQRLKNARKAEATLNKLEPMLQQLQHAVSVSDREALCHLFDHVDETRKADGQTASPEPLSFSSAKVTEALERDFAAIPKQDAVLYRDVNVEELAKDRKFLTLLSNGFSVTEAYAALHLNEIAEKLAKRTGKQIIDNIVARGNRPHENALHNGISGNPAPDVAAMNNEEIDALLDRAQKGESIIL